MRTVAASAAIVVCVSQLASGQASQPAASRPTQPNRFAEFEKFANATINKQWADWPDLHRNGVRYFAKHTLSSKNLDRTSLIAHRIFTEVTNSGRLDEVYELDSVVVLGVRIADFEERKVIEVHGEWGPKGGGRIQVIARLDIPAQSTPEAEFNRFVAARAVRITGSVFDWELKGFIGGGRVPKNERPVLTQVQIQANAVDVVRAPRRR